MWPFVTLRYSLWLMVVSQSSAVCAKNGLIHSQRSGTRAAGWVRANVNVGHGPAMAGGSKGYVGKGDGGVRAEQSENWIELFKPRNSVEFQLFSMAELLVVDVFPLWSLNKQQPRLIYWVMRSLLASGAGISLLLVYFTLCVFLQ